MRTSLVSAACGITSTRWSSRHVKICNKIKQIFTPIGNFFTAAIRLLFITIPTKVLQFVKGQIFPIISKTARKIVTVLKASWDFVSPALRFLFITIPVEIFNFLKTHISQISKRLAAWVFANIIKPTWQKVISPALEFLFIKLPKIFYRHILCPVRNLLSVVKDWVVVKTIECLIFIAKHVRPIILSLGRFFKRIWNFCREKISMLGRFIWKRILVPLHVALTPVRNFLYVTLPREFSALVAIIILTARMGAKKIRFGGGKVKQLTLDGIQTARQGIIDFEAWVGSFFHHTDFAAN